MFLLPLQPASSCSAKPQHSARKPNSSVEKSWEMKAKQTTRNGKDPRKVSQGRVSMAYDKHLVCQYRRMMIDRHVDLKVRRVNLSSSVNISFFCWLSLLQSSLLAIKHLDIMSILSGSASADSASAMNLCSWSSYKLWPICLRRIFLINSEVEQRHLASWTRDQ